MSSDDEVRRDRNRRDSAEKLKAERRAASERGVTEEYESALREALAYLNYEVAARVPTLRSLSICSDASMSDEFATLPNLIVDVRSRRREGNLWWLDGTTSMSNRFFCIRS